MDNLPRESNTSYLPVAGVIVGVIAIVLSGVALAKASAVNKQLASYSEQLAKIDTLESEVRAAQAAAERASSGIASLQRSTQDAFSQVAQAIGDMRTEISKAATAKTSATGAKSTAVAGPGEYIVKSGDTGTKIAAANGVSITDLQAVNPDVNWNRLAVGQKIKLPAKR